MNQYGIAHIISTTVRVSPLPLGYLSLIIMGETNKNKVGHKILKILQLAELTILNLVLKNLYVIIAKILINLRCSYSFS